MSAITLRDALRETIRRRYGKGTPSEKLVREGRRR